MSTAVYEARNPDTAAPTVCRRRWAIVLAGGRGTRLSPLIRQWLGVDTPKQFCTLTGSSSMLQQTVDRARCVIPPEQIIIVIGPDQRQYLEQALRPSEPVRIIEQTSDQGTAGAIFVAVCHILSRDPEATLLILPSDHFLHPSDRSSLLADRACQHAERVGGLVLLGAKANRPETDYGWICPGMGGFAAAPCSDGAAVPVGAFHEKPDREAAVELLRNGCLWNTMITAVEAKILWALGRLFVPSLLDRVGTCGELPELDELLNAESQARSLSASCRDGAPADFSRAILQRAARWTSVLPMEEVYWSDWGRPERLGETLRHLDIPSDVPRQLLQASEGSARSARQSAVG